jgi:hypothetical protein
MKKNILFGIFFATTPFFTAAQGVLELNEQENHREAHLIKTFGIDTSGNDSILGIPGDTHPLVKEEEEKKPYPILLFGTNLTTGSDAVGFRPVLMTGTNVVKGRLAMSASINFTTIDDQEFDTKKTGQALFIHEISNYSAEIGGIVGLWDQKNWKTEIDSSNFRIGLNAGLRFRGNSLFNLDSTTFKSEQNDIFSFAGRIGVDCILIQDHISVYCNYNFLSITNNRDDYHSYFPQGAKKDFWYFQPGFRFQGIEGKDAYKGLIIDFSAIMLTKKMRVITGQDNTLIPVVKIGYSKKIDWKNRK